MLVFIKLILYSTTVFSQVSAVRDPNEDYRVAAQKFIASSSELAVLGSAYSEQKEIVDIERIPAVHEEDLNRLFLFIRDERFLRDKNNFLRRSSWLYPHDGCFARAELAAQRLIEKKYPPPAKIFVFGNLSVQTKNSEQGVVYWWYHVVPAYRIKNQVYILDPATEPRRPLKLSEWAEKMGNDEKKYSTCSSASYIPNDTCDKKNHMSFEKALLDQKIYLDAEWENLEYLRRDPVKELGNNPPWYDRSQTINIF